MYLTLKTQIITDFQIGDLVEFNTSFTIEKKRGPAGLGMVTKLTNNTDNKFPIVFSFRLEKEIEIYYKILTKL